VTDALRHPLSPRLDHCPEGLPREAYLSQGWFDREMATVFARQWVMVGRLSSFAAGTMSRVTVGAAPVIVARAADGAVTAWHNMCPHRGSELCREAVEPLGKLIRCPYHAFAFAADDGRLVATGHAVPTDDFDRAAHGLVPVSARVWNGFLFLNLCREPGPIWADVPLETLDNWPMDGLVTGHTLGDRDCLQLEGLLGELLGMPALPRHPPRAVRHGAGLWQGHHGRDEALGWTPDRPAGPALREGAESWTPDGAPCGPVFPGLTEAEKRAGYQFVTLWPSTYVVAHVDHVRAVRLVPLGPERTRLVAEWYFPPGTLAQPGFDAGEVAEFAENRDGQDGAASEMNQRGIRSPAFPAAG
jgi:glycine betaine catabolism A